MQSVNNAKNGEYVTAFSGNFNATGAEYRYKIADTKIKVSQDMVLSYAFQPLNNLGQNTQVNLLFDDGTYLQAIDNAKDAKGTLKRLIKQQMQIILH